jgi:hypothetical protein
MAYCITSAGREIDYQCFAKTRVEIFIDPVGYFFQYYGLERHALTFLYEEIDIECVMIMEDRDLDGLGFTPLERQYLFEFKRDLQDYYV